MFGGDRLLVIESSCGFNILSVTGHAGRQND